jgi:two-component system, NtrC family, response regulator
MPSTPDDRGFDAETATLAREPTPPPLAALLRVTGVERPPPPFRLSAGLCTIGSAPGCEIVVEASTVSRRHVELGLVPEGVLVRDLGSRNGTFYMGQRIEKMVASLGTTLRLGEATLTIEADAAALADEDVFAGDSYRGIVGASPAMKRLFAKLTKLEGSLATVLVEGESGVGKELVARALHEGSRVAGGPLTVLNCGAMPPDLIASELFGHKKGAFTGAVDDRKGAFELAEGGTLFLDEVGELPLEVQPMLLRALEAREVRPLGAASVRRVQVRVVAATNRDLEKEVDAGAFREDLFYRLAVIKLHVAPLRERREDVAPLARLFARDLGLDELPDAVVAQLEARTWPGNARELRNAVQVYAALGVIPERTRSRAATIALALEELVDLAQPYAVLKERVLDEFTRVYLAKLLTHTGGNQTAAARSAGLDRTYLGRLVQKHGLGK